MKTHPMLFSGPMIRALLDGRKTQTRRILKPQPSDFDDVPTGCKTVADYCTGSPDQGLAFYWRGAGGSWNSSPPFFVKIKVGDLIWARETCATWNGTDENADVAYRADESEDEWEKLKHDARLGWWKLKPSIHMPKWASRITLEVTDVRVQRLQDISADDARAEGALTGDHSVYAFSLLWNSINGPDAWDQNPWVVAYSFTVHKCNVDQMGETNGIR